MLVLYESPAGYALFKGPKESKNVASDMKLKAFKKFQSTADALVAATALVEGTLDSSLKKFLKKELDTKDTLIVGDSKLGASIAKKFAINVECDAESQEVMRAIRACLSDLLQGVSKEHLNAMSLGLAHSMSRYKLKFTADKVDTMIIQAIALLDDLDKELNTYCMRLKEWFGWHFPEMTRVVPDSVQYAKTVIALESLRENVNDPEFNVDLSEIISEDDEAQLKLVAEISMGTEISTEDRLSIINLAKQIVSLSEYRAQLLSYLQNRTQQIAPNLTNLIGDAPLTARLISKAGSLMNLSKSPASTIQILGAEKALFRALKGKKDTPKYGLLFNMGLIGGVAGKNKGRIARMVAAKAALCTRIDALSEDANNVGSADVDVAADKGQAGLDFRIKLEQKVIAMESGNRIVKTPYQQPKAPKIEVIAQTYNTEADVTENTSEKKDKKDKKKRKHSEEDSSDKKDKKKSKKSKKE